MVMQIGSALRIKEDYTDDLGNVVIPAGTLGLANSVMEIEDTTYTMFMPNTGVKIYVMNADRFEVLDDEEAQQLGFEEFIPEIGEE